ncbi:DUF3265 domain-containing protein [Vibrio parahaemolyticus]|nr:DUF3265 domain-containing protein [Vibrio parahaemolyticus]
MAACQTVIRKIHITKRLRQILNAWHSQFKLSFVFKV